MSPSILRDYDVNRAVPVVAYLIEQLGRRLNLIITSPSQSAESSNALMPYSGGYNSVPASAAAQSYAMVNPAMVNSAMTQTPSVTPMSLQETIDMKLQLADMLASRYAALTNANQTRNAAVVMNMQVDQYIQQIAAANNIETAQLRYELVEAIGQQNNRAASQRQQETAALLSLMAGHADVMAGQRREHANQQIVEQAMQQLYARLLQETSAPLTPLTPIQLNSMSAGGMPSRQLTYAPPAAAVVPLPAQAAYMGNSSPMQQPAMLPMNYPPHAPALSHQPVASLYSAGLSAPTMFKQSANSAPAVEQSAQPAVRTPFPYSVNR